MLSIFKKLFGKPEPKAVAPAPIAPHAPSSSMPTIEVAHLSLAAIVARFPDELKPLLLRQPDPASTVALPLPTILKQLPTGSVKMSLASLHRQAHGLIKALPPGDKRSVEVPLAEIFRHVRLDALKRRGDQRVAIIPESGFNLFGSSENPFAIAPDDLPGETPEPEPRVLDLTPDLTPETPHVLKMDVGLHEHFSNGSSAAPELKLEQPPFSARTLAPPSDLTFIKPTAPAEVPAEVPAKIAAKVVAKAPSEPATPKPEGTALALAVGLLAANWPDDIRAEIATLNPTTNVALPVNEVTAGLAKGRVTFSWKQIHSWLEPQPAAPSALAGETMLQLPLKVVAPAFLSASKKPAAERKNLELDADIPALFSDGRPPVEEPVPAPVEPSGEQTIEPIPEAEAPVVAPELPESSKLPETVGEIFGQPHKRDWTPAEIVAGTVTLPGVAGAIVALQEGLQVASSLPEGVKSDVVAAFLPQIFARLNQYSGEMRLGDVDDLLFTTHGAHCQIYRLGYIYFAVLGKAGESLPWHELRLITEELARQTQK